MAYTKTVWQTGDVITAAKLNNMEGGIEAASLYNGVLKVTEALDDGNYVLSETWKTIFDAIVSGNIVVLFGGNGTTFATFSVSGGQAYVMEGTYTILFGDAEYSCSAETDYPVRSASDDN